MSSEPVGSVIVRLQTALREMSPRQRQAAEYILENNKKVAFLNSTTLAKAAKVSESTIIRLAVGLGYDGFPAFQAALQEIIQHELTALERLPAPGENPENNFVSSLFEAEAQSITQSLRALSLSEFEKAVNSLDVAERVYVAGAQASGAFAYYSAYSLGKVRPEVFLLKPEAEDMASVANGFGEGDVALVFGLPRYPTRIVRLLSMLHSRKVPVILVTHSPASPLALNAATVLAMPIRYHSFTDGLSPVICLINALILGVYQKNEARGIACLRQFEEFVVEADVFDTTLKYSF